MANKGERGNDKEEKVRGKEKNNKEKEERGDAYQVGETKDKKRRR